MAWGMKKCGIGNEGCSMGNEECGIEVWHGE